MLNQVKAYFLGEKQFKRVFMLTTLIIICFLNTVYAESLSPFGNFEWSDSIVDVFGKLKKIDSVNEIKTDGIERFRNVNMLEKTSSDLISGIKETIHSKSKGWMFDEYNKELIFKDGTRSLYHIRKFGISASPIILVGIPYKVNFTFNNDAGLTLEHQNKAIKTKINGKSIMCFAQFERMDFTSQDESLALENHQKLYEIIKKKYPVMKDVFGDKWKGQSNYNIFYEVTDGDHSVGFRPRKQGPGIYYMNSFKSVKEAYTNHRNTVLNKELKSSDSSSGL